MGFHSSIKQGLGSHSSLTTWCSLLSTMPLIQLYTWRWLLEIFISKYYFQLPMDGTYPGMLSNLITSIFKDHSRILGGPQTIVAAWVTSLVHPHYDVCIYIHTYSDCIKSWLNAYFGTKGNRIMIHNCNE